MCGIAGFIDFTHTSSVESLKKMTDALIHRGPDDSGYEMLETESYQIGLGNRRLSILDLSHMGHQPYWSEDRQFGVIHNGEIYNFKEIRQELEKYNFRFKSNSDTEVILKSYMQWGVNAVHKFIGMYAFAIYDNPQKKIYIFRDRAGVKPLYYYYKKNILLFSSELKSFHHHPHFDKELDMDSISQFLLLGYIPQPDSIFKHTYKLKSGHYLEISLKDKKIDEKKYWDVFDYYNSPMTNISVEDAADEVEDLFKSAFQYRMVSDVPVGIFLSGGYDSGAIAALLEKSNHNNLNTFSIGFHEKQFNEAPYAKQVAQYLGTTHTEYYCTQEDALRIIPQLADIYDEPFGDSSAIPTILLSRLTREKVKVALSGDGGDECFAGYPKYYGMLLCHFLDKKTPEILKCYIRYILSNPIFLKSINVIGIHNATIRTNKLLSGFSSKSIQDIFLANNSYFTIKETTDLLNSDLNRNLFLCIDGKIQRDPLSEILALDYKTYMQDDILTKVDRATMSAGLEGREPLLDHRIIEFVAGLPSKYKIKGTTNKYLLKKITHKHLPEKLMNRPKHGFVIPVKHWLHHQLRELLSDYLDADFVKKQNIFNYKIIENMMNTFKAGGDLHEKKLWHLLVFQMWFQRWC